MKITSFNPLIIAKDTQAIVEVFEALGDNFDEAYEFLKSKGFVNTRGDKVTDTGSAKATMMASPSGFMISLIEHIK